MSLTQFANRMDLRGKQIQEGTEAAVRQAARDFIRSVVPATPVDTGKARGNWRATLAVAPPVDEIDRLSPDGSESIRLAVNRINRFKAGKQLHIFNNVSYLVYLNNGWSQQAPAGFIERALMDATAGLKTVRVLR